MSIIRWKLQEAFVRKFEKDERPFSADVYGSIMKSERLYLQVKQRSNDRTESTGREYRDTRARIISPILPERPEVYQWQIKHIRELNIILQRVVTKAEQISKNVFQNLSVLLHYEYNFCDLLTASEELQTFTTRIAYIVLS